MIQYRGNLIWSPLEIFTIVQPHSSLQEKIAKMDILSDEGCALVNINEANKLNSYYIKYMKNYTTVFVKRSDLLFSFPPQADKPVGNSSALFFCTISSSPSIIESSI